MTWWLIGALAWVAFAVPAALLIGRTIRDADAGPATEHTEAPERNFVATDVPPAEADQLPWTGPDTTPFPPPGSVPRRRPPLLRNPLSRTERDPSHRDSGVL